MENRKVEAVLKFYRDIDLDIRLDYKLLAETKGIYNTLEGVVYDGLPRGSSLSDQTAGFAVVIAGTETLEREINELEILKTEILTEILSLPPVHKNVIYYFYIKNRKWEWISEHINYSVRQSQNIRRAALENLGRKIEKNKIISESWIIKKSLKDCVLLRIFCGIL